MGMEAALKVFEEEIGRLKKQVEGVRKKIKQAIPSPAAADLLNRYLGKRATFVLRSGAEITGTFVEHDRYNCLVQLDDDGPLIVLKHAIDTIKPVE